MNLRVRDITKKCHKKMGNSRVIFFSRSLTYIDGVGTSKNTISSMSDTYFKKKVWASTKLTTLTTARLLHYEQMHCFPSTRKSMKNLPEFK